MLKLISLLLAATAFFPVFSKGAEPAVPVRHFFTHCLAAYPSLAFSEENPMAPHYDADCMTPAEFNAFLEEAYRNRYVLVDIHTLYGADSNGVYKKKSALPPGKKALVLSVDDMNYDRKKAGRGMCDRLAVDENGALCAYTDCPPEGGNVTYDRELVPILESFIARRPDFSWNGARGVLFLTGYDGILGYRTDRLAANRTEELRRAEPVVAALRRAGWRFACHSYGHYRETARTPGQIADDTDKWLQEVAPLVGETDCYAYPFGDWERDRSSPREQALFDRGFRFFFGVGAKPYFSVHGDRLFMDRAPLTGAAFRKFAADYGDVFSVSGVYRPAERNLSEPPEKRPR